MREQVLTGLGWTILRVWSTDWWFNTQDSIERLHLALTAALKASRAAVAEREAEAAVPVESETIPTDDALLQNSDDVVGSDDEADEAGEIVMTTPADADPGLSRVAGLDATMVDPTRHVFRIADLSSFSADPDNFFDYTYRPTLQAMVDAVMDAEAPIREDILAQRVARAHGWLRTGARIREQISFHLRGCARTDESSGVFLWKPGTVASRLAFRAPAGPEHRRSLADIPIAELVDFIVANAAALDESDPPLVFARLLQIDRLAATSRSRLQEAITRRLDVQADAEV